jgi:hypothetical protein
VAGATRSPRHPSPSPPLERGGSGVWRVFPGTPSQHTDAKSVTAVDIGAVPGPLPRSCTVIDDRVGDKWIGASRTPDLSVALLHSRSSDEACANLNPAMGREADRVQCFHSGSGGAIIKIDHKRIAVRVGFAGVYDSQIGAILRVLLQSSVVVVPTFIVTGA